MFEPAEFVQVRINMLVPLSAEDFTDPLTGFVPDQSPDASHEIALDEVHDKETVFPLATVIGPSELFAFMLTVGKSTQDSCNNGFPTVEPHPLKSVHILVCLLFLQVVQAPHSQFGLQFALTV
jgi:hypothetical protein